MAGRVIRPSTLSKHVRKLRRAGSTIVFTNGCFDLIHVGHTRYLERARRLGDVLVIGVNSDASVRRLEKGTNRPLIAEDERAEVLAALAVVDYVTIFDQDTPWELIRRVRPDVLVKGGDWKPGDIVGADIVHAGGGRVLSLPYETGHSTTGIVRRIRSS